MTKFTKVNGVKWMDMKRFILVSTIKRKKNPIQDDNLKREIIQTHEPTRMAIAEK